MANGDIIGDLATAYLTPEQQAALRGKRPAPTGDLSSASPDASGPVGRATQQLGAGAGQQPQQDVRQTSFDQTNTPAKYLDKGGQQQTPSLNDGLNYQTSAPVTASTSSARLEDAYPLAIGDGRTAIYAGVGAQGEPSFSNAPSSLNTTTTTFGAPSIPQSQRVTSLSDAWQTVAPSAPISQPQSSGLESALPGYQRQAPLSPPQELSLASAGPGYQAPVPQQAPARSPSLEDASPSRGGPQSSQQLPQPLSLSNLAPGDFNGSGATPSSNPGFAALGSAANLGDGRGSFSQFNKGDAKLAHDTFQRAIDLRQGFTDQDALARARQRANIDDSFTTVLDSSRPISQDDIKRARFDQAQKEGDQQAIATASGLITARQQQRTADQQYRQAASLEDLRDAAVAPGAPPEAGAAYFKAASPDKYYL